MLPAHWVLEPIVAQADPIAKAGAQDASPARLIAPNRRRVITHNNHLQGVDSPNYTEGAGTASNRNWRGEKHFTTETRRKSEGRP
jgi:hypothetical protein